MGAILRRSIGTNPDNRQGIGSPLRNDGYEAEQIPFQELNELFYRANLDYAWGTQGQVIANEAHIYTDALGVPKDKNGATVTIPNDSRIAMVHNVTATADILLNPVSGKRFLIQTEIGLDLDMGNVGGGIPWKLIFGSNLDGCDILLNTSNRFEDIPFASTNDEKRYVANQGIRNRIQVNEDVIYDPAKAGKIEQYDAYPTNPYLVRMNGQQLPWSTHASVLTSAWFRDLNKKLNGFRDGSETQSRFTLPAVIGANPHLFQVNTPNGMLRDISTVDPDIHARTDSNGVSIAATVDFVNSSSVVTVQTTVGNIKNFMRLNGASAQGIPDGVSGTTILVDIDETAKTATMVDALTFIPVVATSTVNGIVATIDNSGAAGGSLQTDQLQGFEMDLYGGASATVKLDGRVNLATSTGSILDVPTSFVGVAAVNRAKNFFTDGTSGTPRTGSKTRDNSTDVYIFQQA